MTDLCGKKILYLETWFVVCLESDKKNHEERRSSWKVITM
jgi:hypothetical protein